MSVSPLIARQIPIWDGEKISGFVDLALERAFKYRAGQESERIDIPAELQEREIEARTHMLEQLADHDDELLEQLLMDEAPTPREGASGPRPRNRREPRRVGAVRLGDQLVGRAPPAQGAAPRSARAAGDRQPPRRHRPRAVRVQGHPRLDRPAGAGAGARRADRAKARTSRPTTASTRASAPCSRSRAKRRRRSAKPATATSSRSPRSTRSRPANGSAPASCRRRSRSTIRRATARSRSSPPTARTTSSCQARCTASPRRMSALIVEHDEANHEIRLRGVNDEHLNTVIARLKRRYGVEVKSHAPTRRLPRIDPQAGHPEGPPQEAVGRPRPVRRRDHRGEARCRAARASSSRRRSTAAPCPSNGSRRSRKASARRCARARSASRWSIARSP